MLDAIGLVEKHCAKGVLIDANPGLYRSGLNPRVHPPQPLVPSIVIEHMAGPLPPYDFRLHIFERGTRLQHAQHTYRPATNPPLGSHPPRIFVLVHACLSHVNDRQSSFAKGPRRRLLHLLTGLLQVVAVMFEKNSSLLQEFFHSLATITCRAGSQ